jgi:hypothetical protein
MPDLHSLEEIAARGHWPATIHASAAAKQMIPTAAKTANQRSTFSIPAILTTPVQRR